MAETIRGYLGAFWDRAEIAPNRFERITPGCIINKTAALRLAHNPASGANFCHADIWYDDFGYKFSAVVPTCNARGLAWMINKGCDGISMCFRSLQARNNGVVTVLEQIRLTEISIVPEGCYPSARCWAVGPNLSSAPPAIKALVEQWDADVRSSPSGSGGDGGQVAIAPAPKFQISGDDADDDDEEVTRKINDWMFIKETKPKRRASSSVAQSSVYAMAADGVLPKHYTELSPPHVRKR